MIDANFINSIVSKEIMQATLGSKQCFDFEGSVSIFALDIGYGHVKYIKGVENDEIIYGTFPSQVVRSRNKDISDSLFFSRDTKKIDLNGTIWEVGPDILEIASHNEVRAMHDNFVFTEQWMVLFLGGLEYIGQESIDLMVLGLPVEDMGKEDALREKVVGEHIIGDKTYTVKDVLIVPQPLGALYNYATSSEKDFVRFFNSNTLIIDPGYHTFDFLVAKGLKVKSRRSGSRSGGMSAVLGSISDSISKHIEDKYDDFNAIDEVLDLKNYNGVQSTRPIYVYGEEIDLNNHIKKAVPVIDASLNYMLNEIGDVKDIGEIVMGGGPSCIFELSIKKQFPKHKLTLLDDGIYSNVKGFFIWGMVVYYGMRMKEVMDKSPEKANELLEMA